MSTAASMPEHAATLETFAPRVGETFRTDEIELTLTEASPSGPSGAARPGFALVFRGPDEAPLAQGTYPLENPAVGRLDIFLVPIAPDPDGRRYEAVFA